MIALFATGFMILFLVLWMKKCIQHRELKSEFIDFIDCLYDTRNELSDEMYDWSKEIGERLGMDPNTFGDDSN